ncbi:MAG: hypothetical protein N2506_06495, partial [Dehalococcoidales bacterium]|nr:hypothetical protein [Dehalococcoidales bacterium]
MATIVVSIVCVALIMLGGMTLSQGILTSTDACAVSVEKISIREGEVARTGLDVRYAELTWADHLRVTVKNTGQTKLARFDKWDFIAHYYDVSGGYRTEWLPYTTGNTSANHWGKARIRLGGYAHEELFDPGILNPGEEMVILARLDPLPGENSTGAITVASPNGVNDTASFLSTGYVLLVPHRETVKSNGSEYYELVAATPADSTGLTFMASFSQNESARKILRTAGNTSRQSRLIIPLTGITEIPSKDWTVCYRCRIETDGYFPQNDEDANFNIDVLIRKSDGTVRTVIGSNVAKAYIAQGETGSWLTKSTTYS